MRLAMTPLPRWQAWVMGKFFCASNVSLRHLRDMIPYGDPNRILIFEVDQRGLPHFVEEIKAAKGAANGR